MTPLFTISLLLAAPAFTQIVGGGTEKVHHWDGENSGAQFGNAVSDAGDVNGDGYPDVIVGAYYADPRGYGPKGSAYVYSGADGSLLYKWDGKNHYDSFGTSVSGAGDVNGDGFADVIVGANLTDPGGLQSAGSAFVYSGADGSLLYQWDGEGAGDLFGSVSGAGDVNADGFADVIVGAFAADPGGLYHAGSAYVYSGADGSLLYQWNGQPSDCLGISVSGAGDVNADGFADVIVGAFAAAPGGLQDAGSAYVYSGANGSLLYQWNGVAISDRFGGSVSDAKDVNADGFADVIVGAFNNTPGSLNAVDSAFVYSGADGSLLHQWGGEAIGDSFGGSVSGAGDVDGDNYADLIVGALSASPGGLNLAGSAYVYSGADGSLLQQRDGQAAYDHLGSSVSIAGDINDDGFSDWVVGAEGASSGTLNSGGSAYVFSFHPFLQASARTISESIGGVLDLTLDFPDTAAFQDYRTLMSISGTGPTFYNVDIPLSLDTYLLDSAAGIYPFATTSNLQGTLNSSGNATAEITFPTGGYAFAVGRTFWLAAVSFPIGQLPAFSSVAVAVEILP